MIVDPLGAYLKPFQTEPAPTIRVIDDTDSYGCSWTPRSMIPSLSSSAEPTPAPQTPPPLFPSSDDHWSHPVRPLYGSAAARPAPGGELPLDISDALLFNALKIDRYDSTAKIYHPNPSHYASVPSLVENWSAIDGPPIGTAEDCTASAWTLLPSTPHTHWDPHSMESPCSASTELSSSGTKDGTQSMSLVAAYSFPTTSTMPMLSSSRCLPREPTSSLSNALFLNILPRSEHETQPALLHSSPTTPAMPQTALSSSSPETPHLPLGSPSSSLTAHNYPARSSPTLSHAENETQSVPPGATHTLPATHTTSAAFLPQQPDVLPVLYRPLTTFGTAVHPSLPLETLHLPLEAPYPLSTTPSPPTPSHTQDVTQLVTHRIYHTVVPPRHNAALHPFPRPPISPPHTYTLLPDVSSAPAPAPDPTLQSPSETQPDATSKDRPKHTGRTCTKLKSPPRTYVVKSVHLSVCREVPIVTGKITITQWRAATRVASPSLHSQEDEMNLCHRRCGYSTKTPTDLVRHNNTCKGDSKAYFCIGIPVDEVTDAAGVLQVVEWPGAENMFFAMGCGQAYARKDAYQRHLGAHPKRKCEGSVHGAWWANEKVQNALALAVTQYQAKQERKARRR